MHTKKLFFKSIGVMVVIALLMAILPVKNVAAQASDVGPALQNGADRLVALQNNDGGWDWPLDDSNPDNASPLNTVGPIGQGLAMAYLHTGDADHLAALEDAGAFLLSKTAFSPSDGYLAAQLDEVFGGTVYKDYLKTNFYDKLAAGTYDRNGTLHTTASYIQVIRDGRSGSQANMAAWDVGMGLVGAAACGVDTFEWIIGTKAEIDELDGSNYYDVIGLAGAVYGLAYVNEDYNPAAGEHAAAESLADLADNLASYQINDGGFAWNSDYVIPDDGNEAIQETSYAILALNEVDRDVYLANILGAADYLLSVQLSSGGWENYVGYGENNEITAESLWGISVAYPELWVCETGDCGHPGAQFDTIQGAIDAAAVGATILVGPGTYDYDSEGQPAPDGLIKVKKPVTIKAAGGVRPIIDASGFNGAFKIWHSTFTGGQVVIEGFEILGDTVTGIAITAAMCDTVDSTEIIIRDNVIHGMIGGINFWGSGYCDAGEARVDDVEIVNNEFYDLGAPGFSRGIGVYLEGLSDWTTAGDQFAAVVQGNIFRDIYDNSAAELGAGVGIESPTTAENKQAANALIEDNTFEGTVGIGVGLGAGDLATTQVVNNDFASLGVFVDDANTSGGPANAIANWWGSHAGPGSEQIYGDVDFTPWCAFADCSVLAPDDNGVVNLSGTINLPGGIVVNQPGLTYILADDTVIQNNSPCFVINADYTTITTESPLGAVCKPTAGSNAIDVNGDRVNIVIEGLEIDGTDGGHGIFFAGDITDVKLVDNYIHSLAGDGIYFAAQPAELTPGANTIKGNYFLDNTGVGVNNPNGTGVDATYNAWGDINGPTAGVDVGTTVSYDPWTHVDLFFESSGTTVADVVVVGEEIVYTVYGNLAKMTGADFTFTYPAELTFVEYDEPSIPFGYYEVDVNTTNRTISLNGMLTSTTATLDGEVALLSVTFTGATVSEDLVLAFTFGEFTMNPGSGPSTNIYPTALVDTIDLEVRESLAVTDADLFYGADPVTIDQPLGGNFDDGFSMFLDPSVDWYYLDTQVITSSNPLADGLYPFTLSGGTDIIFYVKVEGTTYSLIDGYQYLYEGGVQNPLRINGDFTPGTYTYVGDLTDIYGTSDEVSIEITFTDALAWLQAHTVLSSVSGTVADLKATFPAAIPQVIVAEDYKIDSRITLTQPLPAGATITVYKDTVEVLTDITLSGTGPFWFTELFDPDAPRADFDANYGGKVEDYVIVVTLADGTTLAYNSLAVIESVISKDGFTTETVLDDITLALAALEVTDADLFYGTDPGTIDTALGGNFNDGFYMALDPAEDWYYLDTQVITSSNPLADGMYPFALSGQTDTIFYVKVEGTTYTLIDGYQYLNDGKVENPLRIDGTFTPGTYTYVGDLTDIYGTSDEVSIEITFIALYDVKGTVRMQGRTVSDGVEMTLTTVDEPTFGPFTATSVDLISLNLSFGKLQGVTYQVTTNQARYLNIPASMGIQVNVSGDRTLAALELKGGNAVWTDNVINIADASEVGWDYGSTDDVDADVNFDGVVNIQDLALVGGNFDLTSVDAYESWTP